MSTAHPTVQPPTLSPSDDDVGRWLAAHGIDKRTFEPLSREDEAGFARRCETGRRPDATDAERQDGEQARVALHASQLLYVVKIARRAADWRGVDGPALMDVVLAGERGLNRAIEKFDPGHGRRLSTYATGWIRKYVGEHLAREGQCRSLFETTTGEDGEMTLLDTLPPDRTLPEMAEHVVERVDTERGIAEMLSKAELTREEQNVLRCRVGFGLKAPATRRETALLTGLSVKQVENREASAHRKLEALRDSGQLDHLRDGRVSGNEKAPASRPGLVSAA